ncbi:MAG: AMP-binding protein [Acidobacteriota bacterium]|nr:MAG: AMP-binding protein [Acidobacteriota bacterium]
MSGSEFQTLIELLEYRAVCDAGREALFVEGKSWTYGELWEETRRFAATLTAKGFQKRDRLVIAIPNRVEFFAGLFGCQLVGVVPVLVSPEQSLRRLGKTAATYRARGVLLDSLPLARAEEERENEALVLESKEPVQLLAIGQRCSFPVPKRFPQVEASDVAFVLMTSGSTGDPKAVQLTHANVMANLRMMSSRMRITSGDVFISWLPTFHDMGLVLMSLTPLLERARFVLLPVRSSPHAWLSSITDFGGTVIAAPDFGYRYCLYAVRQSSKYRLGSLRLALNAAEPVRANTITSFERRFGLHGVIVPAYGLAESTAGVSCCEPGEPIWTDQIGRVSVGKPFSNVDIRIQVSETTTESGEGGEILVRSPSNTIGYLDEFVRSSEPFDEDDWIRTGDCGYLDESGRLFVTARLRDLIIQAGRNLPPALIEEVVDEIRFVRYSGVVGIETHRRSGEQAVVFAELRRPSLEEEEYALIGRQIVSHIHLELGFRPGRVVLVRPRTIPRTRTGKIMRAELRERFLKGELSNSASILYSTE